MADIEEFLKVFGDLPVSEAVVVGAAIIFFINVAKEIGKYYRGKWEIDKEKEQQMQNILDQVKMYPKWHEQSVGIQNDYNKAFERIDEKLDELNAAMVASRVKREEGVALTWRYRILRFDDEIRHEVWHTIQIFRTIRRNSQLSTSKTFTSSVFGKILFSDTLQNRRNYGIIGIY